MATYEKTEDLEKTMTNKQLDEAILTDYENVKKVLPARTSTHIEYKAGATTTLIWNEGETEKTKIKLPLNDGWYLPDKKYGIPNGKPSNADNPEARYLRRHQSSAYVGLLVRYYGDFFGYDRRDVYADYDPDYRGGVLKPIGKTPSKHKHVWICKTCGVERK